MNLAEQILYEHNHLLLLNKRSGQIVQSDETGDACLQELLKNFLKEREHKPGNVFCGVIHRLDRPVSGVVVFAKTSKALSRMNAQVKERLVNKTYWALTKQRPPEDSGLLDDWLLRNPKQNKSYIVAPHTAGAKEASLDYMLRGQSRGGYYLIEVHLHTGRHHQIRTQLSHMGCVIKGDLKYGATRSNPDAGISLHSRCISFEHPVSHDFISVEAPLPNDPVWGDFRDMQCIQKGMP